VLAGLASGPNMARMLSSSVKKDFGAGSSPIDFPSINVDRTWIRLGWRTSTGRIATFASAAHSTPRFLRGAIARDGGTKYQEIGRRPDQVELLGAHEVARDAGLWRLDKRELG